MCAENPIETEVTAVSETDPVVTTKTRKPRSDKGTKRTSKPAGSLSRGAEKIAVVLAANPSLVLEEIVVATGYEKFTVAARLSELKKAGRLVAEGYRPRRYSVVAKAAE